MLPPDPASKPIAPPVSVIYSDRDVAVGTAIILSDVHLGWVPLRAHHRQLVDALDRLADDAELIILNGDIIDGHRGRPAAPEDELVEAFVEAVTRWRNDGRRVVYIEGNHDPIGTDLHGVLTPDRSSFDFEGHDGERIRVLHGHRLHMSETTTDGLYHRLGSRFLRFENWLYARTAPLRWLYPASIGWLVGAVGKTEDTLWRPQFLRWVDGVRHEVDVVVHGHFHFGPGAYQHAGVRLYRSGAWVSRGHRGSVDGVLRYSRGRFERLTLTGDRWVVRDDGR